MIDKTAGIDADVAPDLGWRMKLFEWLKRFKAPVIALATAGAVLSGLFGYWNVYRAVSVVPAATAAPATAGDLSIAVMPFVAAEAKLSDAALADALGLSLTTNLSQDRSIKVAAPGHSTNEPGKAVDARRIGRELNVRYIVLGETRPLGDKLGVTVRLVETENATQFWSERFEVVALPLKNGLHSRG